MNKGLLLVGGGLLVAGGLVYYYIKYSPDWLKVTCWKCEDDIPVSKEFPFGTLCGTGDAVDYPFYIKPSCGGDPDMHESFGYSVKMVYGQMVGRLPGVLMEATDFDTGDYYSTVSDDNGDWVLEVPTGFYSVVASKDGYKTLTNSYVDWTWVGSFPVYQFYSHLEYLFDYDFYYGGSQKWERIFVISDFDDYGAAGHVKLSGVVGIDNFPYQVVDVRKKTEFGWEEITKYVGGGISEWFIDEEWDQNVEDKITEISVWGGGGMLPGVITHPLLYLVDLNFKRLW